MLLAQDHEWAKTNQQGKLYLAQEHTINKNPQGNPKPLPLDLGQKQEAKQESRTLQALASTRFL